MDTIFALSSGRPPAAIAVMRVSGPAALAAARALTDDLPAPRRAAVRTLRDADGDALDRVLMLVFPGPATATGEDLVELHLHGGRAVVDAVERRLGSLPGLRPALPGEFTRRALGNGRIDLAQAEGLADLLEAETEGARRAALAMSEGRVSQMVRGWLAEISVLAAQVEATLDFDDEGDVAAPDDSIWQAAAHDLYARMRHLVDQPSVERLKDGIRIVLAGPRNAGKSSLFNALIGREAAIVSPIAGTTRDLIEAAVTRHGVPFVLIDTAGFAGQTDDAIERIGIDRAREAAAVADITLWLGAADDRPAGAVLVHSRAAEPGRGRAPSDTMQTDIGDVASIAALWDEIGRKAETLVHVNGDVVLRREQQRYVLQATSHLADASTDDDPILRAEHLRLAVRPLATILGVDATEAMLDALFSRFCIGK